MRSRLACVLLSTIQCPTFSNTPLVYFFEIVGPTLLGSVDVHVTAQGSAAAPPTRCRKFRRGSFILNLPSHHSITSSARASSVGGTSRPSALAVFRLTTSSYLVGACTGRSAGFSPLRMRSAEPAARRYGSIASGP